MAASLILLRIMRVLITRPATVPRQYEGAAHESRCVTTVAEHADRSGLRSRWMLSLMSDEGERRVQQRSEHEHHDGTCCCCEVWCRLSTSTARRSRSRLRETFRTFLQVRGVRGSICCAERRCAHACPCRCPCTCACTCTCTVTAAAMPCTTSRPCMSDTAPC